MNLEGRYNTTATFMEITLFYQEKECPPRSVIPAKAGIQCFVEGHTNPGFPFSRE